MALTTNQKRGAGAVVISTALVGFVAHWEGSKFVPYRDIVGVWTVCEGVTGAGVIPGKTYSRQECRDLTSGALQAHARDLYRCITVPMAPPVADALISWTYNVGAKAACNSTLVRRLNAGDTQGACDELLRWNRAGGKRVQGLTNRRMAEREMCLQGVA